MKLLSSFLYLIIVQISVVYAQGSYTIHYRTLYIKSDSDIYKGGVDLVLAIKDSQSYTYSPSDRYVPPIKFPLGSSFIPKSTYLNINKKLLIDPYGYRGSPKTNALIVYDYPDNKWEITNEKKLILGDTCIKAIGKVRGVDVIAWYSPRLPAGFGIYHFVGLPGTILETYMIEKKIQTIAINIDNTSPGIIEPTYYRRVPEKIYWRKRNSTGDPKVYWKEKDFISE